jgi:RHS repeat-associated protein
LTAVTQSGASVTFTYDAANRRTSKTLPNGIVATYTYDAASLLTGITYAQGATVLGTLTYGHDLLGRRTSVGGSWARTTLPSPVTAAYDAANQLSRFGTAPVSYDAAGQLTTDGTHIYDWDGRHQLTSIDGGATGSFGYDGFGRRTQTTLGGTTTRYLYAGANAVQEQTSTGTPTANLLTGGVDEIFTRTDTAGTLHPLGDVQGSTIATSDGSGAIGTTYTYGAFGQTTPSAAGGIRAQYTGRENDGTGLYYYRARYYAPALQRFISEDPLEFGGGDINLYGYVGNDPVNLTDPSGENPLLLACAGGAAFDVALGLGMDWYSGRKDAWSFSRIGGNAARGCGSGLLGFGLGKALGWAAGRLAGEIAETTSLYRAVSHAEAAQLAQTGKFAAGAGQYETGKFFAESAEHAAEWGTKWQGPGNFRVIEARLPTSTADSFMRWERLDTIGPARFGELGPLNAANPVIRVVR